MTSEQSNRERFFPTLGSNRAARLRLFCFPYAGGGASVFRGWANTLPGAVEVCPVQLPGRENRYREKPFTHFSELVGNLSEAVLAVADKPYAFFGYSLGALIAFEVARRIEQAPALSFPAGLWQLFVAASLPPQFRSPDADTYRLDRESFVERLREMGGTPPQILANRELLDFFLPIVRADFQLLSTYTYTPGAPLKCPLTVYGGEQDTLISREKLAEWLSQTGNPGEVKMFSGSHFFINSDREMLLEDLGGRLDQLV